MHGPGLDDGDAVDLALLVEELGHADLLADYAFDIHYSFISMSTPAGNCSRISVSTVFAVGSRMSMSRL